MTLQDLSMSGSDWALFYLFGFLVGTMFFLPFYFVRWLFRIGSDIAD